MSKLKVKSMWILIFLVILPVTSVSGSLVSDISNLYINAKGLSALQDVTGPDSLGGIYNAHLQVSEDTTTIAGVEAIDQIFTNYSSLSACVTNTHISKEPRPLTKSDIFTILLHSSANLGWMEQAGISDDILLEAQQGIEESCESLLTCMDSTVRDIALCKNVIRTDYEAYVRQFSKKTGLTTEFYGTQFYSNGTTKDSAYDLMVDMQLIGDLMYKNNQEPDEVIYYRMPTVMQPSMPVTPSSSVADGSLDDVGLGPRSSSPSITGPSGPIRISDNSPGNIRISTKSENDVSGDELNISLTSSPSSIDDISISRDLAVRSSQKSIPSLDSVTGSPLFGSSICMPTETLGSQSTDQTSDPFLGEDEDFTPEEVDEIRHDYMDYINGHYTSYGPVDTLADTPLIRPGSGDSMSIGSALDDIGMMDQINQCIDTCNENYSGIDALTCKASCLCETIPENSDQEYNKYLDYKVKFCWIPTEVEAPYTSVMRVQSIEEIIDAMNTTLSALRQSGALNKRNETQEYLDTTLRHLNIADSFIFNFNIAFKTNVNTKNEKDIEQDVEESFAQATKKSMIYDINDSKRYSLNEIETTVYDLTTQKEINDSVALMDNIISRQKAIATTLQKNNEFWRQFEMSIQELETISKNMRRKAENGS